MARKEKALFTPIESVIYSTMLQEMYEEGLLHDEDMEEWDKELEEQNEIAINTLPARKKTKKKKSIKDNDY